MVDTVSILIEKVESAYTNEKWRIKMEIIQHAASDMYVTNKKGNGL